MQILQKTGAVLISIIGIIVLIVIFFNPNKTNIQIPTDEEEVTRVVTEFGQKIKNVSLSDEINVQRQIKKNYGEYFSSELLSLWVNDPLQALGQNPSAPVPVRIEIVSSEKKSETHYEVQGNIMQFDYEGGGINETQKETLGLHLNLSLDKMDTKWVISKIVTGPVNGVGDNWILSQPDTQGVQFMYPEPLSTTYIKAQEWPPVVELNGGDFVCEEDEFTQRHMVGDREYCVKISSEGAAGSTYTTYNYAIKQGDFIARTDFTLRTVQCMNYDDPEQTLCKTEQEGFDVDGLADRIISSIRMQ